MKKSSKQIAIQSRIAAILVLPGLALASLPANIAAKGTFSSYVQAQSHVDDTVVRASAEALFGSAMQADSLAASERISLELSFIRISARLESANFWLGKNMEPNAQLRLRVDVRDVAEDVPGVIRGRTGHAAFLTDIVALNTLLLALQASSKLMALENAHPLPWEAGIPMISFGGIEHNSLDVAWKDSNFGSPYFNVVGHPLAFFSMSAYFRHVRGYGQHASFIGGMLMNFLWETMWENIERPLSLHDLVMNTLGAISGAYNGLGLAFGFDMLHIGNHAAYYTEFYAETSQTDRVFVRFYPVEEYALEPLVPWVLGLGFAAAHEDLALEVSVNAIPSGEAESWEPTLGFSLQLGMTF